METLISLKKTKHEKRDPYLDYRFSMTYFMGRWTTSSDNSYSGPSPFSGRDVEWSEPEEKLDVEQVKDKEKEGASSTSSDEVVDPVESEESLPMEDSASQASVWSPPILCVLQNILWPMNWCLWYQRIIYCNKQMNFLQVFFKETGTSKHARGRVLYGFENRMERDWWNQLRTTFIYWSLRFGQISLGPLPQRNFKFKSVIQFSTDGTSAVLFSTGKIALGLNCKRK